MEWFKVERNLEAFIAVKAGGMDNSGMPGGPGEAARQRDGTNHIKKGVESCQKTSFSRLSRLHSRF